MDSKSSNSSSSNQPAAITTTENINITEDDDIDLEVARKEVVKSIERNGQDERKKKKAKKNKEKKTFEGQFKHRPILIKAEKDEGETEVLKRPRSTNSTPEGIEKPVEKKSLTKVNDDVLKAMFPSSAATKEAETPMETENEGTYSDAARRRDLIIVPQNYPAIQLSADDAKAIEGHILSRIDAMKTDEEGPEFRFHVYDKGYLKFACLGEHTEKFLKDSVCVFQGEKSLKIITSDELPKPPLFWVFITEPGLDISVFRTRVAKQNKWIRQNDFKIIKSNRSTKGVSFLVSVDNLSAVEIKKRDGWVHFGLGTIKFIDQSQRTAPNATPLLSKRVAKDSGSLKEGKTDFIKKVAISRESVSSQSGSTPSVAGQRQDNPADPNSSEPQFVDATADLSEEHMEDDEDSSGEVSSHDSLA